MKWFDYRRDRFWIGGLTVLMALSIAIATHKWAIASFAVAVFLAIIIVYVSWLTKNALSSVSWSSTIAKHVHAHVIEKTNSKTDSRSYSLDVVYEYSVDGKLYRGDRLRFPFGVALSSSSLFKQAAQLNGRKSISVFYDPKDPNNCALKKGLSFLDGLALFVFYSASLPVLLALAYHAFTNLP